MINTSGVAGSLTGWTLTIGNQQAQFAFSPGGQIAAAVPGSALAGAAVVQLVAPDGTTAVPPIAMQIDIAPPVITALTASSGAPVNAANPAGQGNPISMTISGLADQYGALPAPNAVDINIGGVDTAALTVTPIGQGISQVQFAIPAGVPSGAQPLTVRVGTRGIKPISDRHPVAKQLSAIGFQLSAFSFQLSLPAESCSLIAESFLII